MRQGQEGEAPAKVSPRRQAAYKAVFKVIRGWPVATAEPANQNARVWRAVEAALDAYEKEEAAT